MKIISCDGCGVLLDGEKLPFPDDIHDEHGHVDDTKSVWTTGGFVPAVPCPVCGHIIAEE